MIIQLRYELTKEDFFEFNYFHTWSDPAKQNNRFNRYFRYWLKITLPTFIFALIVKKGELNPEATRTYLIISLLGVLLVATTFVTAMKSQIRKLTNNFFNDPLNEKFLSVKNYEFSSNKIIVSDAWSVMEVQWEAIVRKAETEIAYYLFLNSHQAFVVPKKNIPELQKVHFDNILKENIPFIAEVPQAVQG
jgi:hypothetical protein